MTTSETGRQGSGAATSGSRRQVDDIALSDLEGRLGAEQIRADWEESGSPNCVQPSYLDAVAHAQAATSLRPGIVQGQIAAALRGGFGDVAFTARTAGSELFVNPLMSLYFTVDLPTLANCVGYLDQLRDTRTMVDVARVIEGYRNEVVRRARYAFPPLIHTSA